MYALMLYLPYHLTEYLFQCLWKNISKQGGPAVCEICERSLHWDGSGRPAASPCKTLQETGSVKYVYSVAALTEYYFSIRLNLLMENKAVRVTIAAWFV